MRSEEIEVTILPDGRIEYTIKGVKGSACESVSALLEKLGQVEHSERTGEYYADDANVDVNISHS
ncbi:MAG: DUF2997 domain-containing protein [Caldilineaceae bacterium]|nr:DUF2997 domain-containing protein [Caldilineaceae bacterium]